MKTCAITGHRPHLLGGYNENDPLNLKIKLALREKILIFIEMGYKKFLSGGALGVDLWSVEILLELKNDYDIYIEIIRPFPSQDKLWPCHTKKRWQSLYLKVDNVIDVSPDPYSKEKMLLRNSYLVDHADGLLAVCNMKPSGTLDTLKKAEASHKKILLINPLKI